SVEETMAADREQNRSRHIEQAAAVSQLRQAVDAIDARSARAEAASRAAVASLEETLAHLEGRIDSKDEAFEDFVGKTEARLRALGDELKRGDDRIAELNASIDDMSAHIEAAEKRSADGINKVSDFVSRLGEKLEETEDRLGGAGELASVAARDAMRDVEAKIAAAQAETDDKLSPVKLTMSHLAERLEEIERRAEEQEEAWRQRDEAQSRFRQVNAPLPLAGDVVSDAAARGGEAADLDIPPVGGEPASQSPFDRAWSAPDTDDIEDAPQGALAEDADLGGFDEAPEAVVEIDYGDAGEPEDLSADPFEDQFALLDDSEAETPEDALWEDELNSPSLADHDNQDAAGFRRRDEGLDVSLDIDETLEADDGDIGDEDDDLFGAEDPFAIAMDEADAAEIEDLPDADEPLATVGPEEGALVAVSSDDLDLELGEELDEELSDEQTASSYLDAARRAAQAAADASGRGDKYRALNVDPDDPIGEPRRGGAPGRVALIGAALLAFVALAVGGRILLKSPGGEAPINVSPAPLTPAAPASLGAPPETAPSPLTSLDAAQERQAALEGAAVQGGVNGPEQISAETPADATPSPRVDESQPAAGSDDAGFAAAAQDDREPAVLYQAALAALEGLGRDVDRQEGVELLKRAAYQSHPPAQFRLGQIYETGRGAPADAAAARRWYERAAFSSNRNAMHNLAVLYARGEGGQQDYAEAARWFEKAANSGLPDSQFNLGVLYEQGRGVNQDHGTAYVWYAIAARSGDRDAELRAEAMTTHLSPARLAEAKTAADGWRAEPLDPQANGLQVADAAPTKAMIAEAQRLLNALGFDAGPADGVIGPRTVTAIRSFETGAGLSSTGRVSTGLLEALRSAS
ncbi:MAG: SEL1-like repeat protein, partial [Pseudomonadota bacterium]